MENISFGGRDQKNILMSANAFLTLKSNLEKNIGSQKTKGFLFRFGKEFGIETAKSIFNELSADRQVGKMHSRVGHVHDVIFKGKIIRHEDGTVECINAHGKWINSFEAELHVKAGLEATEPVCHTLCGFASGALSYEFGASLMVIETKCVAKGDPSCEFEIRLEEDWLPEKSELIALYKNDNLLHELEMTYDALLHHKQLLEKLSVFQTQLTQNVTEKYSMEEIIDEAYRLLNIPIIVEDLFGNLLKQCGLDEDEKNYMYKHPPQLIEFKKNINVAHYQGNGYIKLASPVYINKKKYATCSLVYFPPKKMEETDYLFLEKIANAVALCLLYEEAQFGEQQRIRNSIVERLIYKQNPETIASSFKFLPFPFKPPFITGVLKITDRKDSGNAIDHHEQLMQLTKLFETWQLPAIVGQIGDELIILSAQMEDIKDFKTICKRILRRMAQSYPDLAYSLGLSQIYTEFHEFEQSLKEARIAERFPNKQMLTDYEDLGMLGDLVIGLNESQIREIAKKTLKGLYDDRNHRKKELLHTLYIYLLNGQRLKETMEYLHLSIGGIQYRIKQIEEFLGESLKNASLAAYILLIIQALILIGELDFE